MYSVLQSQCINDSFAKLVFTFLTALFSILNSSNCTQFDNDFGTDPEARRLYLKHGAKYLSSLNFQTVTFFYSLLQKTGFFRHKHYSFLRGYSLP